MPDYVSTDPNYGAVTPDYVSTDPNYGLPHVSVRTAVYGPVVGERYRDAMFGPEGNPLGPDDLALSPDDQQIFPRGSKVQVDGQGKVYTVADSSYRRPGQPNSHMVEFRDQTSPPPQVTLTPAPQQSPQQPSYVSTDPNYGLVNPAIKQAGADAMAAQTSPYDSLLAKLGFKDSSQAPDVYDTSQPVHSPILENAVGGAYDVGKGFVQGLATPSGIAGMVSPLPGAYHEIHQAIDRLTGRVPINEPPEEAKELQAVEQTPPGSRERFAYGLGQVANLLMAKGIAEHPDFGTAKRTEGPANAPEAPVERPEAESVPGPPKAPETPPAAAGEAPGSIQDFGPSYARYQGPEDLRPVNLELQAIAQSLGAKRQAAEVIQPLSEPPVKASTVEAPKFGEETTPVSATVIDDIGGIVSKSQAAKSGKLANNADLWDDAPSKLSSPTHNKIYSPGGAMPDVAAQYLYDNGLISEPSPAAMWRAIKQESASTITTGKSIRERAAMEAEQAARPPESANAEIGQSPAQPPADVADALRLQREPSSAIPSQDEFAREVAESPTARPGEIAPGQQPPPEARASGVAQPEDQGMGAQRGQDTHGVSRAARAATDEVDVTPAEIYSAEDHITNGRKLVSEGADTDAVVGDALKRGSFSRDAIDLAVNRDAELTKAARVARRAADDARDMRQTPNDGVLEKAAREAELKQQQWEDRVIRPIRGQFADTGHALQTAIDLNTGDAIDYVKTFRQQAGREPSPVERTKIDRQAANVRRVRDAQDADIARRSERASKGATKKLDRKQLRSFLDKLHEELFKDCVT